MLDLKFGMDTLWASVCVVFLNDMKNHTFINGQSQDFLKIREKH